jgi:hypothetical protein
MEEAGAILEWELSIGSLRSPDWDANTVTRDRLDARKRVSSAKLFMVWCSLEKLRGAGIRGMSIRIK